MKNIDIDINKNKNKYKNRNKNKNKNKNLHKIQVTIKMMILYHLLASSNPPAPPTPLCADISFNSILCLSSSLDVSLTSILSRIKRLVLSRENTSEFSDDICGSYVCISS